MGNEKQSEDHVRAFLEAARFEVIPIPRAAKTGMRTADFRVSDGVHSFTVEVTEKSPEQDYRDLHRQAQAGDVAVVRRTMDREKRLADAIDDKADQLRRTLPPDDFRIVWITAFHGDARHLWERLMRTVFGIADLRALENYEDVYAGKLESLKTREYSCAFYDPGSFADHTDLHAVAFSATGLDCLFVNPLAPEHDAFRASSLARLFEQRTTLIDLPSSPDVLVLDGEIDRTDPHAKWCAIRRKYGLVTQRTNDSVFDGLMVIPL